MTEAFKFWLRGRETAKASTQHAKVPDPAKIYEEVLNGKKFFPVKN